MTKNKAAVAMGKKGGKARTEAQRKARSENLRRAREKRWTKKDIVNH